jgi:hypothetical protein
VGVNRVYSFNQFFLYIYASGVCPLYTPGYIYIHGLKKNGYTDAHGCTRRLPNFCIRKRMVSCTEGAETLGKPPANKPLYTKSSRFCYPIHPTWSRTRNPALCSKLGKAFVSNARDIESSATAIAICVVGSVPTAHCMLKPNPGHPNAPHLRVVQRYALMGLHL